MSGARSTTRLSCRAHGSRGAPAAADVPPRLAGLLDMLPASRVSALVAVSPDRLSRYFGGLGRVLVRCEQAGVRVIFAHAQERQEQAIWQR